MFTYFIHSTMNDKEYDGDDKNDNTELRIALF